MQKKWLKSKLSQCKSASKSWKIVIDRNECSLFKYIDTFSIKLNYLRQWNIFMWSQRVNANKKMTFYRRAAKFIRISHTISSSITYISWRSQNCTTFFLSVQQRRRRRVQLLLLRRFYHFTRKRNAAARSDRDRVHNKKHLTNSGEVILAHGVVFVVDVEIRTKNNKTESFRIHKFIRNCSRRSIDMSIIHRNFNLFDVVFFRGKYFI